MAHEVNNCLLWALRKWRKEGGYLCFRKSRHNHCFIKRRKMQTNKAIISGDERTVHIYDDDGQTLLHSFDVSVDKLTREPQ